MVDFYDYAEAETLLKDLMVDRANQEHSLSIMKSNYAYLQSKGYDLSHGTPFYAAKIIDEENETEATFAIQGIVCDVMLAPFSRNSKHITEKQAQHLRQSVSLTGYGVPAFRLAVDNILEIHARYERILPDKGSIKRPSFISTTNHGGVTIDFANRFFTPVRYVESETIPIPVHIDPYGALTAASKSGYVYTEDNEVRVMAASKKNTKWRFNKARPQDIHKGDIVEIQFNLTLIHAGSGVFILKPILREIARFDDTLSLTRAKRQLVYEEAEDDDIEIDVQRMKDVKLTNGSG
ncbi:hypothetical protein EYR38_003339 [Pleurotus pulmonarius]|nr:hypothetical protein EYR38_003339 [Pleurotus pulmonarius]